MGWRAIIREFMQGMLVWGLVGVARQTHLWSLTSNEYMYCVRGFPGGLLVAPACQFRRRGFNPWMGNVPWRRKWQPTQLFSPGKSHGQKSLAGYSPWGRKRVGHDWVTKHVGCMTLDTQTRLDTCDTGDSVRIRDGKDTCKYLFTCVPQRLPSSWIYSSSHSFTHPLKPQIFTDFLSVCQVEAILWGDTKMTKVNLVPFLWKFSSQQGIH